MERKRGGDLSNMGRGALGKVKATKPSATQSSMQLISHFICFSHTKCAKFGDVYSVDSKGQLRSQRTMVTLTACCWGLLERRSWYEALRWIHVNLFLMAGHQYFFVVDILEYDPRLYFPHTFYVPRVISKTKNRDTLHLLKMFSFGYRLIEWYGLEGTIMIFLRLVILITKRVFF